MRNDNLAWVAPMIVLNSDFQNQQPQPYRPSGLHIVTDLRAYRYRPSHFQKTTAKGQPKTAITATAKASTATAPKGQNSHSTKTARATKAKAPTATTKAKAQKARTNINMWPTKNHKDSHPRLQVFNPSGFHFNQSSLPQHSKSAIYEEEEMRRRRIERTQRREAETERVTVTLTHSQSKSDKPNLLGFQPSTLHIYRY